MKVGKALYNILGSSTEIQENFPYNTTDYAPSSTELITNGNFSATSTTKILDGDFPTPNVNWILHSSTINGGSATITGLGSLTSGGAHWSVSQDVIDFSVRSYKVTFTAKQLTGTGAMYSGIGYYNTFNQVVTGDFVTYTFNESKSNICL